MAWLVLGAQELHGRDTGTLERVVDGDSAHGILCPGRGDAAG